SILPEGTKVTKGQEVVKFDTETLQKNFAEQEIKWKQAEGKAKAAKGDLEVQLNKSEGEIAEAELNQKLADLDLEKYVNGDYKVDENAKTDLEAAEVTAKLERDQTERLREQLKKCVVKAPQDGILVYSKDRYYDPAARIQAGAMVYFQQTIFSLPDLSKMQVKVKV